MLLDSKRKIMPKSFVTGKISFFKKFGSRHFQVLKKWSYNLHIAGQITFWTIKMFLNIWHVRQYEKNRAKAFFHRKDSLFFKILCFQQHLMSWEIDLKNCTINFRIHCCIYGPCFPRGVFEGSTILLLFFFLSEIFKNSPLEPQVFRRTFVFRNLCL